MSWLRNQVKKAESQFDNLNLRNNAKQHHSHLTTPTEQSPVVANEQSPKTPTPQNPTLFQAFEWHTPAYHWSRLTPTLPLLSSLGITNLWLPPGCKANSPTGNGYDIYDLWDLGEFDQKWTRSTKWGSRADLETLIAEARGLGISVVWDAVLNHKTAGDRTEECWAVEVEAGDRRQEVGERRIIEPWIVYEFPGRGGMYSGMKWGAKHFNGTDWDQKGERHAIFKIVDKPECAPRPGQEQQVRRRRPKGWAQDVDDLNGNADYLMFSNIDHSHPEVRQDLMAWGRWMVRDVGVEGFRLDAVPHYSWNFAREWIAHVRETARQQGRDLLVIGEYWMPDVLKIVQWVDRVGQGVKAIDAPLHANFSRLSQAKLKWEVDLRKVFRGTLTEARPDNAVTMITSHDTQPGQTMATRVEPCFKTLAYALMLLRKEGLPSVFYGDLHGTQGPHAEPPACGGKLPILILCRKLYAYGTQTDYLDSRSCIGWVRHGAWDRRDGCAVVMSIRGAARLRMFMGQEQAGRQWTDVLGNRDEVITVDDAGYAVFTCSAKSVSVWVRRDADGRESLGTLCHADRFRL